MKFTLALLAVAAPLLVSASLNCTATAEVKYYTCPDANCHVQGIYKVGDLIQYGCAADGTVAPNRWLYNWNGFYTQSTTNIKGCTFQGQTYQNTDVLPFCKDDPYVPTPAPCVCQPEGAGNTTSTSVPTTLVTATASVKPW
ncbi:hypothetical protein DFH27DRAFT_637632 [Peziza echinospora]|nr:hypothetical protein DFH27DRAFT_637632 [Peziza echinospora]